MKEAHRTLKLDGRLHIYEATSRFSARHKFAADLERLEFGQVTASDERKFTHIVATNDSVGRRQDVGVVGGLRGESSSMVSTEN